MLIKVIVEMNRTIIVIVEPLNVRRLLNIYSVGIGNDSDRVKCCVDFRKLLKDD